jgi:carbon monoxide dehydrogenase subunit G
MLLQGERTIAAPRADVWHALNDPDVLKACIPGCAQLTKVSGTKFEASVVQKVGPVKARFNGVVELSDIVKNVSYTISGEGKGGAAGFAKGGAKVYLEDIPEGTCLTYEAEAKVGGKLAQLGGRLIDGFARKLADEFFTRFQNAVEEPEEADSAPPEGVPEDQKKGWFRRMIG